MKSGVFAELEQIAKEYVVGHVFTRYRVTNQSKEYFYHFNSFGFISR
jgi:hypothetical protein